MRKGRVASRYNHAVHMRIPKKSSHKSRLQRYDWLITHKLFYYWLRLVHYPITVREAGVIKNKNTKLQLYGRWATRQSVSLRMLAHKLI